MNDKCIAFYLRLSMSDGDLGENNKDESNSIENQRTLLENYIMDKDDLDGKVREYIDDGYTGTNFDRPRFQQMLKDAGKGEISVILVKDLSRLGRDYIGVGDYVEQIFPMLGVRFIAVNNNFDSSTCVGTGMGLDFAVNNLVNDFYSHDVSRKIRSTFEVKWRQGQATSARVPFGYLWNKNSKKKWEIDPVASKYVRKVFDYALKGDNTRQIAVNMNFEHIPTPGVYAKMTAHPGKGRMNISPDSEKLWSTGTVSEIIRKYEYTGALVMRKRERLGSEHVSVHVVPREDQIVIENAHDAIVTSEEFNLAQGAVRTVHPIAFKTSQDFPLKKIVRCGTCRRLMGYSVKDGEYGFHCEYAREFGSFSSCRNMFYRESEMNTRVMYAIRQVISIAGMLDERMENENARTSLTFEFPDPEKIRSEIEILKAERVRQYEAYSDRTITRENYLKKKNELSEKISCLEEKLLKAEELIKNDEKVQTDIKNVANAGDEIPTGVGLTAETAQKFVESVYIYDETHMEIVFKCEDTILAAFDKCTANTDGVLISSTADSSLSRESQSAS